MSFDQDAFRKTALVYLQRWQCVPDGEAFFTHSSLLWPALMGSTKVMLKIPNPGDDEVHGAEILKLFAGHGAVRVLENDQHIYLLERIGSPGHATLPELVEQGADDDATRILCEVITKLHQRSASSAPPMFAHHFRQRSDSMMKNAAAGNLGSSHDSWFELAFDVSRELMNEFAGSDILLHGDIHHFNVLRSADRGWLAIDPKGIAGPRIYEYANSLVNPYLHPSVTQPKRMARQAEIMCEMGKLDRRALLRFTFVHAFQCAAWSRVGFDQQYWLACAETAAGLSGIPLGARPA